MKERCGWVTTDPIYIEYHDHEWGEPCFDRQKLFAMLCLEGQQAGLSWITVLKKRQHYFSRFHQFVPEKVAAMSEEELASCLQDPGLIRNRLKVNAIVRNAQALLAMEEQGEDFVTFLWSFVGQQPQCNHWQTLSEVPAKTDISDTLSKALKKRGFTFVGSTICYAFMQACGLVNDHVLTCFRHPRNQRT